MTLEPIPAAPNSSGAPCHAEAASPKCINQRMQVLRADAAQQSQTNPETFIVHKFQMSLQDPLRGLWQSPPYHELNRPIRQVGLG